MIVTPTNSQEITTFRSQVAMKYRRGEYTARLALDHGTKQDAYRLRYDSYLDSGFIEPNEAKTFSDKFDTLENSTTIVVYAEGQPIASVRACFLSRSADITSPAKETYPQELESILGDSTPNQSALEGVEITRLVRSPAAANNQGLIFLLYRLAGHLALLNDFRLSSHACDKTMLDSTSGFVSPKHQQQDPILGLLAQCRCWCVLGRITMPSGLAFQSWTPKPLPQIISMDF